MQFIHNLFSHLAAACSPNGSFFGLPTWYKYLEGQAVDSINITGQSVQACSPIISGIGDVWKIVAAVIDMLLRVAILVAIGFVLFGGVKFMTSQGQPDKIKGAISTVSRALIGLIIAVGAATLVSYVAGKF